MRELGPEWETDLAVCAQTGGQIAEHPEHLVIRTPTNPLYHWGNFVLVTELDLADRPERCVALFEAAFPTASWTAIGLPRMPIEPADWQRLGLGIETSEALTLHGRPRPAPLPPGYTARQLGAADWAASAALAVRENDRTAQFPAHTYADFAQQQAGVQAELTNRGSGAWFGAFAGAQLVADLGILNCGRRARFRSVGTDFAHRGRGLASHLLGLAADWALAQGCTELVILTETSNAAGRVYRRAGFRPVAAGVVAYRA